MILKAKNGKISLTFKIVFYILFENILFEIDYYKVYYGQYFLKLATLHGYLNIVKWLDDKGLIITHKIIECSATRGHLNILKWFVEDKEEKIARLEQQE